MADPLSIVVIGAGPGGEAAAERAAARGAKVTLVEKNRLGGLCLNCGCIPSKALLEAGRLIHAARAAAGYVRGADDLRVDWDRLQDKKNELVDSLRTVLAQNYSRLGVRVVQGRAEFADARTVLVRGEKGEERLAFDAAVLAAGSEPFFPPPFDRLRDKVLDSDRALSLARLPARIAVVGGGAVGCEFACLFQELGVGVLLIEKTEGLLPGEDPAVVRVLHAAFEARGMRVRVGTTVESSLQGKDGWSLRLSTGDTLEVNDVLVCVGRRPSTEGLGLEKAGIAAPRGRVEVDEFLKTSNPRVHAVGDVNGLSLLAHAAAAQAETAVDHIFGSVAELATPGAAEPLIRDDRPYRNELVPRCLYTWPEIASVGEWGPSALARGLETKSQRFFFKGSAKAIASNEGDGFIQVVSNKADGRLRGAQIIGPHATELIHIFAVALAAGQTADQLRSVIFAHPTLAEGIREALSR